MDSEIDDLFLSPPSCNPSQPLSTTTINDPAINRIYEYLRDAFSNTKFDTTQASNFNDVVNQDTSDSFVNLSVDHYQQSQTVNPICTVTNSNQSQPSNKEPIIQCDSSKSKKITIISHPRSKFRPRTEKESKDSSHYLRCEDYIQPEYPTISIEPEWKQQKNLIEVTLVDKDKEPHPYTIENKERKISSLIFKENEQNSIYFHVTKQDYEKQQKTFLIEFIKPKQDNNITKDLIKTRQLEQSMLRFTRFYQISDGSYQQDESSTEYSCLMIEDYGDFSIEDVFPLYGPMCGNHKVCVELKGHLPKDLKTGLIINITENKTNWSHQVDNIRKNGNNLTFLMPSYPYTFIDHAKVNILVSYKQDITYQCSYTYTRKLDEELAKDDLNESGTTIPLSNISSELTGVLPTAFYTTMDGEIRGAKRPRQ